MAARFDGSVRESPTAVPCGPNELCKGGQCVLKCVPSAVTLDIVFVMDTSGSMGDEAAELCAEISGVRSELEALGLTVTVTLLGIAGNPGGPFECLTSNVNALFGSDLHLEAWGPATAIVAESFPWTTTARVIVPISDEGPYNGDPCDDPGRDRDAIENAIVVANENGVIVSPIAGTGIGKEKCVATLGQDLAAGTGGTWHQSTDDGLAEAIFDLVIASLCACTGDLNGDGDVGIADFLLLLVAWDTPGADLDGNGNTDISDFLILLSQWGPCP